MSDTDVLILGGGAMGTAAAWHLARRGCRVAVLEQYLAGHDHGSSHGHSRVVRQAYYEHPDYVPLLRRSFELFRESQELSGLTLLDTCGALFCGPPDGRVVSGSLHSGLVHRIPHERLDAAEVRRRFPGLALPDDHVAVWEPGAGYAFPERTIRAHARLAMEAGARVLSRVKVLGWRASGSGFVVQTDEGDWHGSQLVITAGAWATDLLPRLPLQPTRQVFGWAAPAPALPVWLVEGADGTATYGIPPVGEGPEGMKVAVHGGGTATHPDDMERRVSAAEKAALGQHARRWVPALGEVHAASACLYTNTPDGHFIIDTVGERIWAAVGFSGHGFKFAPVVGEILAELVIREETRWPIDLFSAARFDRTA